MKNHDLMNVLFDARDRKSVSKIKASTEVIDFVVNFLSGDMREEGQGRGRSRGTGGGRSRGREWTRGRGRGG